MEIAPGDNEAHHLGLAASGCHFYYKAEPFFVEHAGRYRTGGVVADQVILIFDFDDFVEVNDGLDGFPLGKIIRNSNIVPPRLCRTADRSFWEDMLCVKPPRKKGF